MKGVSVVTAGIRCRSFNGFSETTFSRYRQKQQMTTGRKYILDILDVVGVREKSLTCRIAFFLPRVKRWSSGTDSKTKGLNVEKCIAFINTWLVGFKNLTVSVLTGFSPCVQNKYKSSDFKDLKNFFFFPFTFRFLHNHQLSMMCHCLNTLQGIKRMWKAATSASGNWIQLHFKHTGCQTAIPVQLNKSEKWRDFLKVIVVDYYD